MPIRVYNEDKETEVDEEEEVVYPRRGSSEELSASVHQDIVKNVGSASLVRFFLTL